MKKLHISLLSIILLLSVTACAVKKPDDSIPVISDADTEIEIEQEPLDQELTEPWPEIQGAVTLTDAEKKALETSLGIEYVLDEHSARLIQQQFLFLVREHPRTLQRWIIRSGPYLPYIKKVFQQEGLPEELAYLPFIESGFNPKAYSHAGAAGIWQFMSQTGRNYGLRVDRWIDERRDPFKATYAAAGYFKALYGMFHDWTVALASYNAGEAKLDKACKQLGSTEFFAIAKGNDSLGRRARLRKETLDFVPRFLAICKIVANIEELGLTPANMDANTELAHLQVKPGTNLKGLAKACGMSWKTFLSFNLAHKRVVSPPGKQTTVHIPLIKTAEAKEYLSKPVSKMFKDHQMYTVRRGDSWSVIGKRFGVSVAVLKTVNNTRSNRLRIGQRVIVPIDVDGGAMLAQERRRSTKTYTKSVYKVRRGDTWSAISARTGVSVRELKRYNRTSSNMIRPGQKVKVPGARPAASSRDPYEVRRGDTLSHVAARTGTSVKELLKANGLNSPKDLRAGQKLVIPGKTKTASRRSGQTIQYKVRKGDTIWALANRFNTSETELLRLNNMNKRSVLRPGDTIKIVAN